MSARSARRARARPPHRAATDRNRCRRAVSLLKIDAPLGVERGAAEIADREAIDRKRAGIERERDIGLAGLETGKAQAARASARATHPAAASRSDSDAPNSASQASRSRSSARSFASNRATLVGIGRLDRTGCRRRRCGRIPHSCARSRSGRDRASPRRGRAAALPAALPRRPCRRAIRRRRADRPNSDRPAR